MGNLVSGMLGKLTGPDFGQTAGSIVFPDCSPHNYLIAGLRTSGHIGISAGLPEGTPLPDSSKPVKAAWGTTRELHTLPGN